MWRNFNSQLTYYYYKTHRPWLSNALYSHRHAMQGHSRKVIEEHDKYPDKESAAGHRSSDELCQGLSVKSKCKVNRNGVDYEVQESRAGIQRSAPLAKPIMGKCMPFRTTSCMWKEKKILSSLISDKVKSIADHMWLDSISLLILSKRD